jgi:hypothetical protein
LSDSEIFEKPEPSVLTKSNACPTLVMTMALIACWRKLLVLCNLSRQKKSLAGSVNNLALNNQPSLKPCHSKRRNS